MRVVRTRKENRRLQLYRTRNPVLVLYPLLLYARFQSVWRTGVQVLDYSSQCSLLMQVR